MLRASSNLPEAADILITLEVFKAAQKGENIIYIVHGGDRIYDTIVHQIHQMINGASINPLHYQEMSFITHQNKLKKPTKAKKLPLNMDHYRKPLTATLGDLMATLDKTKKKSFQ
jgi:hypothetical protein